MNVQKAEAGSILFREGERNHLLSIVADGAVLLDLGTSAGHAEKGCLLGVPEREIVSYPFTYTAKTAVTLYQYDYQSYDDLNVLLTANRDACGLIAYHYAQMFSEHIASYRSILSSCRILYDTICEEYENYKQICAQMGAAPKDLPGIVQLADFEEKSEAGEWLIDYYDSLASFSPAKWRTFFEKDVNACTGFIIKTGVDLNILSQSEHALATHLDMICDLAVSEYKIDLFTFYLELFEDALQKKLPHTPITTAIERLIETIVQNAPIDPELTRTRFNEYKVLLPKVNIENNEVGAAASGLDEAATDRIREVLRNSLATILTYAELYPDEEQVFKEYIRRYAALDDRSASDEDARKLRRNITVLFYEIYRKCFLRSLQDQNVPTEVKMLFLFGFVDMSLSGESNALYLYLLAKQHRFDPTARVFCFYDWLLMIYNNRKEPCVNEFKEDYSDYLHKKKVAKEITDAEEALARKDGVARVNYEIDNMFRSVGKMISGHVITFCPVFSDHELYRPLDSIFLNSDEIQKTIDRLRSIDFSLFYRETIFTAPESGIAKEVIEVETLPDIILMPGIGSRGAMWQEITGKKRTSSARFVLPLFMMEDLQSTLAHICGEFRWELCRRIQGMRWNDPGERSLTSDYCNYLETFRHARDLTPEAREKIKSAYSKCRNSSKEMFARDYCDYVLHESAGSLRLNKPARTILFRYCPFSLHLRISLSGNQIYKELADKFQIKRERTVRLTDLAISRIEKAGHEVPAPIREYRSYLDR